VEWQRTITPGPFASPPMFFLSGGHGAIPGSTIALVLCLPFEPRCCRPHIVVCDTAYFHQQGTMMIFEQHTQLTNVTFCVVRLTLCILNFL
jgi:hypothetical protein